MLNHPINPQRTSAVQHVGVAVALIIGAIGA